MAHVPYNRHHKGRAASWLRGRASVSNAAAWGAVDLRVTAFEPQSGHGFFFCFLLCQYEANLVIAWGDGLAVLIQRRSPMLGGTASVSLIMRLIPSSGVFSGYSGFLPCREGEKDKGGGERRMEVK